VDWHSLLLLEHEVLDAPKATATAASIKGPARPARRRARLPLGTWERETDVLLRGPCMGVSFFWCSAAQHTKLRVDLGYHVDNGSVNVRTVPAMMDTFHLHRVTLATGHARERTPTVCEDCAPRGDMLLSTRTTPGVVIERFPHHDGGLVAGLSDTAPSVGPPEFLERSNG